MLLSELTGKTVYAKGKARGTCLGVGVSLKNGAVKYLLCSPPSGKAEFCINVSAVEKVDGDIFLSRLNAVFPKTCVKLSLALPVYSGDGVFLGNIQNAEFTDFTLMRVFTDENESFSFSNIAACADAVLLKKRQPYPIGQRIPAHALSRFSSNGERLVSKALLRRAIKSGNLIALTLSLSPFNA